MNLLDQTQAPQPLQSFCEDFARAVEAYAKVTSAGSLADLTKLCEAMCLLAGVLGRWPSESDLSDDFKQCGFGGHGAPVFVRTAHGSGNYANMHVLCPLSLSRKIPRGRELRKYAKIQHSRAFPRTAQRSGTTQICIYSAL